MCNLNRDFRHRDHSLRAEIAATVNFAQSSRTGRGVFEQEPIRGQGDTRPAACKRRRTRGRVGLYGVAIARVVEANHRAHTCPAVVEKGAMLGPDNLSPAGRKTSRRIGP